MGDRSHWCRARTRLARDVYRVLAERGLLRDDALPAPAHRFLATGDPAPFAALASRFLGPEVGAAEAAGAFARDSPSSGAPAASPARTVLAPATCSSTTASVWRSTWGTARSARCRGTSRCTRWTLWCVSHLHADHCIDLTAFYVAHRYGGYPFAGPVAVYGPSNTAEHIASAIGMSSPQSLHGAFTFREVSTVASVGPFRVRAERVAHPVEAYGIRFEADGASLTYSGDTGPCRVLDDLAQDVDVLLAERRPSCTDSRIRATCT